jgi:hypothetical protein
VADRSAAEEIAAEGLSDAGVAPRRPIWRRIEALAEAVGGYCWMERRLFELTGSWAAAPGDRAVLPELRVFFAAVSRRHGCLAERWAARLPVRAGIDATTLVEQPPNLPQDAAAHLSGMSETADAVGDRDRLGGLVDVVLPWLAGEYGAHLAVASPVSEASVMEVLVQARRSAVGEVQGGRRLLGRLDATGVQGRLRPAVEGR